MAACPKCGEKNSAAARFCSACGRALATEATDQSRRMVSAVFADVVGSTALGETLDSEAVRAVMARFFGEASQAVERHGGQVQKFIGDAVVAVFGTHRIHEDDALRAVRAAWELREPMARLDREMQVRFGVSFQIRTGINSGEVFMDDPADGGTLSGDTMNTAARLEQAAAPGEILIGEATYRLVRDAVQAERLEPISVRGKAQPITAHRLLAVGEAPQRRHESRFVGRRRELELLREAWDRASTERRCVLVTVVGQAGVGKSRLVAELFQKLDARVVRGRCLPYGDGITYWPLIEILKQLRTRPSEPAAEAAIASLLGETDAVVSAEDIAWAFRKTIERSANGEPLAIVFDDIHWGEQTFIDLIEHVALLSSGSPILLVCMARPELAERRHAWPVTLRLEPLGADDVEELIPDLIAQELRERIARAAGGNPLFISEMLAMAGESGGEVVVPPTLQALLAARLDMLEGGERSLLQCGAVEGEIFHRGALHALAPDQSQLTPRLAALVRKELIRPDQAQFPGEDAFRFRHLLIRDAAYDALPKAARADLHERLATWLGGNGAGLIELDEILGYHSEQAVRYRDELGLADDGRLRAQAHKYLAVAGRRASAREDHRAAARLLERAAAQLPPTAPDATLELELADALFWSDNGVEALRRARALAERATALGDPIRELSWRVLAGYLGSALEPEGATDQLTRLVEQALPIFETAGDDVALCIAHRALAQVALMLGQMDTLMAHSERAAAHAKRAGLPALFDHVRVQGTIRASEVVAQPAGRSLVSRKYDPWALAWLGRFEEARALLAELLAEAADRGPSLNLALLWNIGLKVELLAGDPAAAVVAGERSCKLLDDMMQPSMLSTVAGELAGAYYQLGQLGEAEAWSDRAKSLGASDDLLTQMLWRQTQAKVLACRGEHTEAERLAREAIAICEGTDMLNYQADVYADLGEVLLLGGRTTEAAGALQQALSRYERKENIVSAAKMRERLSAAAHDY